MISFPGTRSTLVLVLSIAAALVAHRAGFLFPKPQTATAASPAEAAASSGASEKDAGGDDAEDETASRKAYPPPTDRTWIVVAAVRSQSPFPGHQYAGSPEPPFPLQGEFSPGIELATAHGVTDLPVPGLEAAAAAGMEARLLAGGGLSSAARGWPVRAGPAAPPMPGSASAAPAQRVPAAVAPRSATPWNWTTGPARLAPLVAASVPASMLFAAPVGPVAVTPPATPVVALPAAPVAPDVPAAAPQSSPGVTPPADAAGSVSAAPPAQATETGNSGSPAPGDAQAAAPVAPPPPTAPPDAPGASPPGDPANYTQTDGRTVVNGVLASDVVAILGGYLGGGGLIDAQTVVIGAGATVNPGNSPGTLHVAGNWQQQSLATLVIEIVSPTVHDVLDVRGTADFARDSRILFLLDSSSGVYLPGDGDDIEFLLAERLTGLENISYAISGLPAGFHYQVYVDGQSDLHVRFYADLTGSATPPGYVHALIYDGLVPVPSTLALVALGLALMGWRKLWRKRSQ